MLLSLFSSTLGWSLARQDISHLKSTRQNQNEEKLIVLTKWTKPRLINWVINGLLVPVSVHASQHNIRDNNQPDQADNRRKWKWGVLSKKSSWDCCECNQPAWHVGQSCRLPHQARHFQGAKVIIWRAVTNQRRASFTCKTAHTAHNAHSEHNTHTALHWSYYIERLYWKTM